MPPTHTRADTASLSQCLAFGMDRYLPYRCLPGAETAGQCVEPLEAGPSGQVRSTGAG
jgi:hypothetical protein